MEQLVKKLTTAYGISGREDDVAKIVQGEMQSMGYQSMIDVMTNVLGFGSHLDEEDNPIMLFAHTDEIGMKVQRIADDGLIYFKKVGGFSNATICNSPVDVIPHRQETIHGVVGLKPPHLMDDSEYSSVPKTETLYVDAGFTSKEQATKAGIRAGTPIYFPRTFFTQGTRIFANALDDRAGVAVMLDAMQNLKKEPILAVGSVQEEVGIRGARTSVFGQHPLAAIVLDVTFDSTQPGVLPHQCTAKMGDGPVITLSSRGMETCPAMEEAVTEVADSLDLPVQWEISTGGGTDADIVHLSEGGVPTLLISIPNRYMHSTVECVDSDDLLKCSKLVTGMVKHISRNW